MGTVARVRILVTGATGFIGLEVARQLADAGDNPRLLVRRVSRAPLVAALDAEVVHADLGSRASLRRAVAGMDAVIHLAGRATFESADRLRPTLVEGTRDLVAEAVDAGVRSIVFGSSAFVHEGGPGTIDATTPPAPVLGYGHAKLEAEAVVASAAARGLACASLRLPHVYGPHSLLFGLVRRGFVPFPGHGRNRFAQLHVVDAAAALIAAARTGWSGTAPIADAWPCTWNEFFEVLTTYAPGVRIVRVDRRLAQAGADVLGRVLGAAGPTMTTADTIRGWNLDVAIDSDATWTELGLRPAYRSVLEGIPATLDDVVAFRWRHPVADRRA